MFFVWCSLIRINLSSNQGIMSILNSPTQDLNSMVNYFKLAKKHIRRNQMKDTLNKRKCVKSTKRILNNCLKNDIKRAIINQCKIQLSHFKDSFAHTFIGLKFTSYCSESGGWKCCYRPIENVKPGQKKIMISIEFSFMIYILQFRVQSCFTDLHFSASTDADSLRPKVYPIDTLFG
jgi:hypothetical protein